MKYLLLACAFFLSSIAYSQGNRYKYTLKLIEPQEDETNTFIDSNIAVVFAFDQIDNEIEFLLTNKSKDVLKLIWDEVAFVQFGETKRLMHKGVKYIDRNSSTPPTVIPPGASLNDVLVPTENVSYISGTYFGGWKQGALFPDRDYNKIKFQDIILSQKGKRLSIFIPFKTQTGKDISYNFVFEITDVSCINCKEKKVKSEKAKGAAYFNISPTFAGSQNVYFTGGGRVAFGYYNSGFAIGAGAGGFAIPYKDADFEPYFPIFVEVSYIGKNHKLSPYISGNVGYSIFKGPATVLDKTGSLKGGLYTNLTGGVSIPIGKNRNKAYVFGGVMPVVFERRYFDVRQTFNETFFCFGIGIMAVGNGNH